MIMKFSIPAVILSTLLCRTAAARSVPLAAGNPNSTIDVVARNYTDAEGTLLQGYLSLPTGAIEGETKNKYPAVIILHDADGPNEYEQQRATILADTYGYVGFAADIFGVFAERPPPDQPAWAFTGIYTGNATLFSMRTQAAIDYVQSLPEVDETKIALIGYCMGGTGVVHYLNTHGDSLVTADKKAPIVGAIGVHPSLSSWPGPLGNIEISALFLTGGNDFLTSPESMAKLEADMTAGTANVMDAPWETVRYAEIEHAFSNWFSDRYNERVDARSWHSSMTFLEREFGLIGDDDEVPDSLLGDQTEVGYVYTPADMEEGGLHPVVILLPNAYTVDENDQLRAQKIVKDTGYIAFLADVYTPEIMEMYNNNITNVTQFVLPKISMIIDHVKDMEGADPNNIAIAGFGMGGSFALHYAVDDSMDMSVKVISSFHGELGHVVESWEAAGVVMPLEDGSVSGDANQWTGGVGGSASEGNGTDQWTASGGDGETRRQLQGDDASRPKILIQSGVESDDMVHVIMLESALISMGVDYELTRFSDTQENFTIWSDANYDARATSRSMDQLYTALAEVFPEDPLPVNTPGTSNEEETVDGDRSDSHEDGEHSTPTPSPPATDSSAMMLHSSLSCVFATIAVGLAIIA